MRAGADRSVARRWTLFAALALGLYAGLYAASEYLVYRFAEKNRFFSVHRAAPDYDLVILRRLARDAARLRGHEPAARMPPD